MGFIWDLLIYTVVFFLDDFCLGHFDQCGMSIPAVSLIPCHLYRPLRKPQQLVPDLEMLPLISETLWQLMYTQESSPIIWQFIYIYILITILGVWFTMFTTILPKIIDWLPAGSDFEVQRSPARRDVWWSLRAWSRIPLIPEDLFGGFFPWDHHAKNPNNPNPSNSRAKGVWTRHHCDAEQSQAQGLCCDGSGRFFLSQQNWGGTRW